MYAKIVKVSNMSNGAVMFRMISMFREDMQGTENVADAEWIVNASYKRSRGGRKVSASLTAENVTTHELLTFPQDHAKITSVMPDEYWPSFIKDLQVPVPIEQAVLV